MTEIPENPPRNRTSTDTRFKPGQSGNPKGRPKGSRNISTLIDLEFSQRIAVTENGKRMKISKGHAAIKQQVNKAVGGDTKAFEVVMKLKGGSDGHSDTSSPSASRVPEAPLTLEEAVQMYQQEIKND